MARVGGLKSVFPRESIISDGLPRWARGVVVVWGECVC